ncbi:IclR family transcriptional regulator domain-containing protein [Paraburkholderia caribensis]|uniref:IclR family transcriptional regulator domain-containing protein n=1 Tax=Paraburkholderia caribensis TaxID=75105 RepID=UPI001CC546D9|nr:IclR family transcriptional regulator C-terminal domain-containing protein [Paraburkholderia caribensis]
MEKTELLPDPELYVDAFARGLSVIRAFDAERRMLSLAEVAEATGISRASARRLLATLVHLGYVHADGRTFRLTPKVMQLGYAYLSGLTLTEIVEHYVVDVAEKTGESCSVCVLDDTDVVYVARASTQKIMSINLAIGTRLPAWATATGRVLLGCLDEKALEERLARSEVVGRAANTVTAVGDLTRAVRKARTDGYAFTSQELEDGLTAVAVPLVDKTGRIVAAMNVAGHVHRNSREKMLKYNLQVLQHAAAEVNLALASRGV